MRKRKRQKRVKRRTQQMIENPGIYICESGVNNTMLSECNMQCNAIQYWCWCAEIECWFLCCCCIPASEKSTRYEFECDFKPSEMALRELLKGKTHCCFEVAHGVYVVHSALHTHSHRGSHVYFIFLGIRFATKHYTSSLVLSFSKFCNRFLQLFWFYYFNRAFILFSLTFR